MTPWEEHEERQRREQQGNAIEVRVPPVNVTVSPTFKTPTVGQCLYAIVVYGWLTWPLAMILGVAYQVFAWAAGL